MISEDDGHYDYDADEGAAQVEWTCEACGQPVAQTEGLTTAAAVRAHASKAGHDQASVRRVLPSGTVQRWRTEAEREQQRAKEPALRAEEQPRRATLQAEGRGSWKHRSSSARSWALPELAMPTPEWLGLGGLGAVLLGILLYAVGYEAGYCAANPQSDGYNMRVSGSCLEILSNASGFEVFAGHVWGWVLLAGVMSLVGAAVLWVRHQISPMG